MRKCLDSILAQTFTDYECLLIDDGSTDGSPAICDEYAAKDTRFKAYHKLNGGLSDARNYGLERAQGEYTIFFDPDDWVDKDCLKDLFDKAVETDADFVVCDYFSCDMFRSEYKSHSLDNLNHYSVLHDMIVGQINGYTWNKLLRRELYSQYDIKYPKGIYGCEDLYTMCELLKHDIKIAYLPKAYYHYMYYGNTSQSRKYDENTYLMDVKIKEMFISILCDTPFGGQICDIMTFRIFSRAFYHGYGIYSSALFKQRFHDYIPLVKQCNNRYKILYLLSAKGFYRPCRWLFQIGFDFKQILKRIKR